MNNLIERYIYDVTRRLPEGERDEVRRELAANIADMLPENPIEQDIAAVLTELGAPSKLAEQYRQKPRYLISPAMYDTYISVLKPIILIVALATGFGTALAEMMQAQDVGNIGTVIGSVIGSIISGAFQGAFSAAFWVTIGFVINDKVNDYSGECNKRKPWTVNDLPKLPDNSGVRITRTHTITAMALTVFFTGMIILLITKFDTILILAHGGVVIHPFATEALYRTIPYVIALGCLSLMASGVQLYYERWNIPVCIVNTLHNVVWVFIVIHILRWPDLWSGEFLSFLERTFTAAGDILSRGTDGIIMIISGALVLAAVVDSAVGVWNTYKGRR